MTSLEERQKAKSMQDKVDDLNARRGALELGGGKDRIEKHHQAGKLSARERIAELVDKNSFEEIGLFAKHRATYFGMAGQGTARRRRGHRLRHASMAGWCILPARTSPWPAARRARCTAARSPT